MSPRTQTGSPVPVSHVSRIPLLLGMLLLAGCGPEPDPLSYKGIIADLERVAASPTPSLAQVQPYAEGLVFHHYRVREVLSGELRESEIQVGHWAVAEGRARPVDTEIGAVVRLEILPSRRVPGSESLYRRNDLPPAALAEYIEVPPPTEVVTTGLRMNYGGPISTQMELYWSLRHQLRLVAVGNSRTGVGVLTGRFFPEVNAKTPIALNLSPPGSNMDLQALLVNDYLMPLPDLQWVVWGISPRFFNARRRLGDRLETFQESPGYQYDREHWSELWPIRDPGSPLTAGEVSQMGLASADIWGATPREDGQMPVLVGEQRAAFLEQFSIVRFSWDQETWAAFGKTVAALDARGVRVLLFTPPLHPAGLEGRAADPDNTGREHEAQVVAALQELDRDLGRVWFHDIHAGGRHGLREDDFSDAGHLDLSGAEKLTARLVEAVETHAGTQP